VIFILAFFRLSPHLLIFSSSPVLEQDFRQCQKLIQKISSGQSHPFPPSSQHARHEALAAKNVQRGLAAKVQELSTTFRKKQRVYMESMSPISLLLHGNNTLYLTCFPPCPCDSELQGHAIKNQDLLIASGTISSKGSEGMSAVDDDMEAAVSLVPVTSNESNHSHFMISASAFKPNINSCRRCHS
jgi:syntaxin 16